MRVAIDGIAFENPHQRGIQRYFRELIAHFPPDAAATVLITHRPRATLPSAPIARTCPAPIRALPPRLRRAIAPALSRGPRTRRERAADVFHSSYYTLPQSNIPSIVSVQDMIVERFTDYYPTRWADEEVRRKRKAILGATVLLTGSSAAAAELRAFYPSVADRIETTPYGADHIPESAGNPAAAEGGPYALFVGDRALYKNFRCILEAMGHPEWPRPVGLRVIGPEPRQNELALAGRVGGSGRVQFLGRVSDADLARLYAGACATLVPSLEEGFGFPVLEGQRAGRPVICSDIPVFREIAGDSAMYFDPLLPATLADAVARIRDTRESERLREAGLANARRYTWARCAQQTIAVYERAINRCQTTQT